MFRSRSLITVTAVVAACVLPVSAAARQDLRSPDARDAAEGIGLYGATSAPGQDLRSPDTQDAADHVGLYAKEEPRVYVYRDLRSPDARDAARELAPAPATTVALAEPAGGFDWGAAGIGAAGMLALVCIAAGGMLIAGTRRRRRIGVVPS